MSFFSKILKGLGFEDDEQTPKEPKLEKKKDKKEKLKPDYASFDLKQEVPPQNVNSQETKDEQDEGTQNASFKQNTANALLDIIKVSSQVEVQNVVNKLKNGERVIINMLALSSADLTRSLDFLTGAVYALDKTMQKVDNAIYIIQ